MCLAPILIDNPDYNTPVKDKVYRFTHNIKDRKIPVPCGRCASCVHLKQIYLIQRVQMEALNHDLFYGTLTYNKESLPVVSYGDIRFAYPDFSDWQKMIKMINKDFPDLKFKYMLVSEYGGKKHRPHYHFILSLPKESDLLAQKEGKAYQLFNIFLKYWRRNYGSRRVPIWKQLCTYVNRNGKYNFDLHYLDPNSSNDGLDGVSFYVTKYILKFDTWVDKFKSFLFFNLSDSDYIDAWNKFRPRCLMSKFFGSPDDVDVKNHIRNGINFSLDIHTALFPYYVSKQNGSTYPLAPYYAKKFLTISDKIEFVARRPEFRDYDESDVLDFDRREEHLNQIKSFLSNQQLAVDYDDIDNINSNILPYGYDFKFNFSAEDFADCWEDH